jgi:opacity protein-like surface antigen
MKKFTLTVALFCACTALIYAGPEPMASKEIAPMPAPQPSCFEGWYFGVHGGAILTEFDFQTSAFEETLPPRSGGFSEFAFEDTGRRKSSLTWEGGLHAGYNWQRGSWVFGLEVDIQGSDFERQESALAFIDLPTDEDEDFNHQYSTEIHSTTKLDWYSTGRIRIGHTLGDRIMVFGTGGGAVGLTELSESTSVFATTTEGGAKSAFLTKSDKDIRGGWTGGGGVDFCLSQHWMLNFTYLYVDLGDASVRTAALLTLPASNGTGFRTFDSATRTRADFQFHVFQGGLTFHF